MNSSRDGTRIVAFYHGQGTDHRGQYLDDILGYSDRELESWHDYIQWLFPMAVPSGANPNAPLLDEWAIEAFEKTPLLRANLRRALDRMLKFYGLERTDENEIFVSSTFDEHAAWLTPGNHNHLRITRMLTSLCALGEEGIAQALFACLRRIAEEDAAAGRERISQRTIEFWTRAMVG